MTKKEIEDEWKILAGRVGRWWCLDFPQVKNPSAGLNAVLQSDGFFFPSILLEDLFPNKHFRLVMVLFHLSWDEGGFRMQFKDPKEGKPWSLFCDWLNVPLAIPFCDRQKACIQLKADSLAKLFEEIKTTLFKVPSKSALVDQNS
jgi:hypothetical protein